MRIFMTGVTGFAGSHLAELLLNEGHQVWGLVHESSGHQPVPKHPQFTPVIGDLMKLAALSELVSGSRSEILFHLAGQASPSLSWTDPSSTFMINTGGTANVLEAARVAGCSKLIVVTSGLIYGKIAPQDLPITEELPPEPTHPYGISKWAASQLIRLFWKRYQLPVIEARPLNHVGPRQALGFVVPDFAKQISAIKAGKSPNRISVGDLSARRDFTDVRDVVRAYLSLAVSGKHGQTYLVCSGKDVSIQSLLEELISLAGIELSVEADPTRIRPLESSILFGSPAKIQKDTGWRPIIPLRQSLEDSLEEWMGYWLS